MIRINLLPYKKKLRRGVKIPHLNILVAVFFFISVLYQGFLWYRGNERISAIDREISATQQKLQKAKNEVVEVDKLKKDIENLEKRTALIEKLIINRDIGVYILEGILNSLPANLWLMSLEEKDSQVRITGTAFSSTPIWEFMVNLKKSGYFQDVDLVVSRMDIVEKRKAMLFEIICKVKV